MLRASASPAAMAAAAVAPTDSPCQLRRRLLTSSSSLRLPSLRSSVTALRCYTVEFSSASPPAVKEEKGLAERLRMGSLVEDGLSYKESFIVKCYEVGINKTATVETIANLLQIMILEMGFD